MRTLILTLSEGERVTLDRLVRDCNLKDKAELFNLAITLFEWAMEERRQGREIASLDHTTKTRERLVFPALDAVATRHS